MKKIFCTSILGMGILPLFAHGGASTELLLFLLAIFLILAAFVILVLVLIIQHIRNAPKGTTSRRLF
jgi:hypothetical protein